jgi:hypothetical protein
MAQSVVASINFQDPALEALSARLVSELANAGYKVRVAPRTTPGPCVAPASSGVPQAERVHIALVFETSSRQTARAAICYVSATQTQQAVVTAPGAEVERFGVLVMEALNGLRARAPRARPPATTPPEPARQSNRQPSARAPENTLSVAPVLVFDATHREPLLGPGVATHLPIASKLTLSIDSFASVTPWRVTDDRVEVSTRLAWLRAGLRRHWAPDPFDLAVSFSVGPALTWATATTNPPTIGKADVAVGLVASTGVAVEYPKNSTVFLVTELRASTLVPRVRLQLASGRSDPFGELLFEGLLGMGFRWVATAE